MDKQCAGATAHLCRLSERFRLRSVTDGARAVLRSRGARDRGRVRGAGIHGDARRVRQFQGSRDARKVQLFKHCEPFLKRGGTRGGLILALMQLFTILVVLVMAKCYRGKICFGELSSLRGHRSATTSICHELRRITPKRLK